MVRPQLQVAAAAGRSEGLDEGRPGAVPGDDLVEDAAGELAEQRLAQGGPGGELGVLVAQDEITTFAPVMLRPAASTGPVTAMTSAIARGSRPMTPPTGCWLWWVHTSAIVAAAPAPSGVMTAERQSSRLRYWS